MGYFSENEILKLVARSVEYPIGINPYYNGLEYFKKFDYIVTLAPINVIPTTALDDIIYYFRVELPEEKKVCDVCRLHVVLKRCSIQNLKQISLGYHTRVMVWFHYHLEDVVEKPKKSMTESPVRLKIARPVLR
jgi:hypothetical protein